jgi:hypothetical protein
MGSSSSGSSHRNEKNEKKIIGVNKTFDKYSNLFNKPLLLFTILISIIFD